MRLKRRPVVALVAACALLSCSKQVVDHEARTYASAKLAPFLDAVASQLCQIKYSKAPTAAGRLICPEPPAVIAKAPVDGDPGPPSDDKDSEARSYIRYELEPYLDSLAYQLCHVKFRAAPEMAGGEICPGPPEGYKKPPGNGTP
ncbi:MAG TPA: hypothetical protein VIG04_10060 [Gemmatimonadales bacterium]|jgi:hypothetical protein